MSLVGDVAGGNLVFIYSYLVIDVGAWRWTVGDTRGSPDARTSAITCVSHSLAGWEHVTARWRERYVGR